MFRREHKPKKASLILVCIAGLAFCLFLLLGFPGAPESDHGLWANPGNIKQHDCYRSEQGWPVFANKIEGVPYPFFISIADLGTAEKPNRNFQRMSKGKLFQKPDISETIQKVLLESSQLHQSNGIVLDVGANVGMAAFAAAALGFRVLAFEPVVENLNKLCDGVYLNRVGHLVTLFQAAVSDSPGVITLHKVIGRLDNSAVSMSGAKLAFKNNQVVPFKIPSVSLDSMIPDQTEVALLKIDVQGWEFHVLRGATKLLSRPARRAPYLIYEEDDKLLAQSNSSSSQIHHLLNQCGYKHCSKLGNDRHCSKKQAVENLTSSQLGAN